MTKDDILFMRDTFLKLEPDQVAQMVYDLMEEDPQAYRTPLRLALGTLPLHFSLAVISEYATLLTRKEESELLH